MICAILGMGSAGAGQGEVVVVGGALLDGVVDDDVAVGHGGNLRHFVGNEYDCGCRGEVGYNVVDSLLEQLVEIAEGLVEHKDFGLAYYGTCQKRALQLSAGKAVECEVAAVGHPDGADDA